MSSAGGEWGAGRFYWSAAPLTGLKPLKPVRAMKSVNGKTTEQAQSQTAQCGRGQQRVRSGDAGGQPNLTVEVPQTGQQLLPGLAEFCPLTNFD